MAKVSVKWSGPDSMRPLLVPVGSVKPDAKNARTHPERSLAAVLESFRRFGQQRALVVHAFGREGKPTVIAGNAGLAACVSLGWTHVAAVPFNGTDAEARAYALVDNRSAEISHWNNEWEFAADAMRGLDDATELIRLLDFDGIEVPGVAATAGDASGDEAPIPSPPRVPTTKRGQVWRLGAHRLVCGDSADSAVVLKAMRGERAGLMNTDPPYGIGYANEQRPNPGVAKARVAKDDLTDQRLQAFLESVFHVAVSAALAKNAAWYLWHAHLTQGYFAAAAAAAAANVMLHRQIIWVKPSLLLGRGQYHWRHEPCFMGWVKGHAPPDYGLGHGERTQTTVWELKGVSTTDRAAYGHATPKPVALFQIPIAKHLRAGDVCFDPFAGTGPQFIAAERAGVSCRGIEIDPRWCDVIVERWQSETGGRATLEP